MLFIVRLGIHVCVVNVLPCGWTETHHGGSHCDAGKTHLHQRERETLASWEMFLWLSVWITKLHWQSACEGRMLECLTSVIGVSMMRLSPYFFHRPLLTYTHTHRQTNFTVHMLVFWGKILSVCLIVWLLMFLAPPDFFILTLAINMVSTMLLLIEMMDKTTAITPKLQ